MPRIIKPTSQYIKNTAEMSGAESSGQGLIAIGQAQLSNVNATKSTAIPEIAGQITSDRIQEANEVRAQIAEIEARNREHFERTRSATNSAIYNQKMQEATLQYMKAQQDRATRITDDDGKPIFDKLVSDLGAIGDEISSNTLKGIDDPEVASKFSSNFSNFVSNQRIMALGTARKQQADYTVATLTTGLQTLKEQGVSDDIMNIGTYEQQGLGMLDDAVRSGALTLEDRTQLGLKFSREMRLGNIEHIINSDTARGIAVMGNSPSALGISTEDHDRLTRVLGAKIEDNQRAELKEQAQIENDRKNKEALLVSEIELQLQTGTLTKETLEANSGKLSSLVMSQLRNKFEQTKNKELDTMRVMQGISTAIKERSGLSDYSPSDIDKHFNSLVQAEEQQNNAKSSFLQQSFIASSYTEPVKSMNDKLESAALGSLSTDPADLISSYTLLRDKGQGYLVSKMSPKARTVLDYAELLTEQVGIDPAQAIARAREQVVNVPDDEIAIRKANFREEFLGTGKPLNPEKILNTMRNYTSAGGFFKIDDNIPYEALADFRRVVEVIYNETGDKAAALELASKEMSKVYGNTHVVTGEPFMFAPPELTVPDASPNALRYGLLNDLSQSGLRPKDISDDDISIMSDRQTIGGYIKEDGKLKQRPSYVVTYKDSNTGIYLPVLNPKTGLPLRWYPDNADALNKAYNNSLLKQPIDTQE